MPSLFNERHVNNHVIYVEAVQFFRSCDDSLFVFFKVLVDAFFAWIFSKTTNKFTKPKKKKQNIKSSYRHQKIPKSMPPCLAAWLLGEFLFQDRMRGNMKFIGHLFLRQLLSAKVIGSVICTLDSGSFGEIGGLKPHFEGKKGRIWIVKRDGHIKIGMLIINHINPSKI